MPIQGVFRGFMIRNADCEYFCRIYFILGEPGQKHIKIKAWNSAKLAQTLINDRSDALTMEQAYE